MYYWTYYLQVVWSLNVGHQLLYVGVYMVCHYDWLYLWVFGCPFTGNVKFVSFFFLLCCCKPFIWLFFVFVFCQSSVIMERMWILAALSSAAVVSHSWFASHSSDTLTSILRVGTTCLQACMHACLLSLFIHLFNYSMNLTKLLFFW